MKFLITTIPFLAAMLAITSSCLASALAPDSSMSDSSDLMARAPSSPDLQARGDKKKPENTAQWSVKIYAADDCNVTPSGANVGDMKVTSACVALSPGDKMAKISATGHGTGIRFYYSKDGCVGDGPPGKTPPDLVQEATCMSLVNSGQPTVWHYKYFSGS